MPVSHFVCPDGEEIAISDCIEECRMARRCSTVPYLIQVSDERRWDGTPHVTQLIQGTMEAVLKITHNYSVSPTGPGSAFSTLGIGAHAHLQEKAAEIGHPAELHFKEEGVLQGTVDYLEPNPDGTYNIWDYKTWGSYAVARAKGIVRIGMGKGKMPQFTYVPSKVDNADAELQLNGYRVWVEKMHQIKVRNLYIQAVVRDGNTFTAKDRGVTRSIDVIPVNHLPDELVTHYFTLKGQALMKSLELWESEERINAMLCSTEERWQDNKCREYCRVADYCYHGQMVKGLPVEPASSRALPNSGRENGGGENSTVAT